MPRPHLLAAVVGAALLAATFSLGAAALGKSPRPLARLFPVGLVVGAAQGAATAPACKMPRPHLVPWPLLVAAAVGPGHQALLACPYLVAAVVMGVGTATAATFAPAASQNRPGRAAAAEVEGLAAGVASLPVKASTWACSRAGPALLLVLVRAKTARHEQKRLRHPALLTCATLRAGFVFGHIR